MLIALPQQVPVLQDLAGQLWLGAAGLVLAVTAQCLAQVSAVQVLVLMSVPAVATVFADPAVPQLAAVTQAACLSWRVHLQPFALIQWNPSA